MLSTVTIDDKDGNPVILHQDAQGGKRWLTSATGLRGIANLRASKRVRPQAHGGINETRYEDGRAITLQGEIMSTVGIEDAFSEWSAIAKPLMQTLDNGPALLKWTEGETGNELQMLVKLDGDLEPPFQEGQAVLTYQAQFFAEDPRAYAQTPTTVVSTALSSQGGGLTFPAPFPRTYANSGGGIVSFTNDGNRSTPPVFQIDGMCVNPQILLVGTGLRLVFNGTVALGDYLEIDVAARTVKLNGETDRMNFYDGANTTWFELDAGTSDLQMLAASFDANAKLTVIGRSAWA